MSGLAVVSCHFNPCGYRSRVRNYRVFRRFVDAAPVRHLSVELLFAPDGESELGEYDDVLTLRGGDVMWQKERLLTVGIERLIAEGVTKLAVFDADLVLDAPDWPRRLEAALDEHDCVQCFETISVAHDDRREVFFTALSSRVPLRQRHVGGGWAFTAEFAAEVGLYQHALVGGADRMQWLAWGNLWRLPPQAWAAALEWIARRRGLNPAMTRHFAAWAAAGLIARRPWRLARLAGVHAALEPHGAISNRQYFRRQGALADLDPEHDVRVGPSGAFVWASDKPVMHAAVRRYFELRREDG